MVTLALSSTKLKGAVPVLEASGSVIDSPTQTVAVASTPTVGFSLIVTVTLSVRIQPFPSVSTTSMVGVPATEAATVRTVPAMEASGAVVLNTTPVVPAAAVRSNKSGVPTQVVRLVCGSMVKLGRSFTVKEAVPTLVQPLSSVTSKLMVFGPMGNPAALMETTLPAMVIPAGVPAARS